MKIQNKPDYLIFADESKTGELDSFPDVLRGWGVTIDQTQSKPPMEWMNGAFNRVDANVLYLLQQGIPEWDGSVLYPVDAVIKYKSKLYIAIAQNDNAIPSTNTTKWARVVPDIIDASTTQKGVVKLNDTTSSTSTTEAATANAVKVTMDKATNAATAAASAQTTANNALPLSGGTLTGSVTGTDFTGNNITAKTSLTVGSTKATYSTNGLNFDKPLLINNTPVLKQGESGLGGISSAINGSISTLMKSGFYAVTSATSGSNKPFDFGTITLNRRDATIQTAIATETTTGKLKSGLFLSGAWAWREIITTENISSYQVGLGVNQTYKNVTSERVIGATYTNTTGKPIFIKILTYRDTTAHTLTLEVDGVVVARFFDTDRYSNEGDLSAIIPAGSTYKATCNNTSFISNWIELR